MRLFHIATVADWEAARASGGYTTSTRDRTLAEEGFIHAARADQWQGVRDRYYADAREPLVLLEIDSDLLTAPVVEEHPPGTDETFPHIYGAIEPGAVLRAIPLGTTPNAPVAARTGPLVEPWTANASRAPQKSFFSIFVEEVGLRAGIGIAVLVLAVLLGLLAQRVWGDVTALVVILVAITLGFVAGSVVLRRRDRRYRTAHPTPETGH